MKILKKYDADEDGMLNSEEFEAIFEDFTHIEVAEDEILECFETIDTKGDGLLDMEELQKNGIALIYFWVRNNTLEDLKTKFLVF